jgi:hypothetical protein
LLKIIYGEIKQWITFPKKTICKEKMLHDFILLLATEVTPGLQQEQSPTPISLMSRFV